MKATIIGSDLLQKGNDVQFLEINTNTTIYNSGAEMLDYTALFEMLVSNNISEFHFIWTEVTAYTPLEESFRFKELLEEKCIENDISFTDYVVPMNSITVPFIEDASHKFILRQSYDTTALIDETYCADKFEFFNLMSGSQYTPSTYFSGSTLQLNEFNSLDTSNPNVPNTLIKAKSPTYDLDMYPALYTLSDISELTDLKNELGSDYLVQEFIYSDDNIVDDRYSIIRSIDIIYGSELDVINLGGYKQSTIIPMNFTEDEFVSGTKRLNQKSRIKYISKPISRFMGVDYHTDDDSVILDYTGSLVDVDTIQLGDYIKSVNFQDIHGNNAAALDQTLLETYGWEATLPEINETLTPESSSLVNVVSASVDTIYIRITLEDGKSWVDSPSCTYFIEENDSTKTRFEKVNNMVVGDKLVVTDSLTNELTTIVITSLEMEHAQKTIYNLDFEPSDLFLVDVGDGLFSVMHNSCWCPWNYCGYFCNYYGCPTCGGGGFEKV
jgi:hypothetical protein